MEYSTICSHQESFGAWHFQDRNSRWSVMLLPPSNIPRTSFPCLGDLLVRVVSFFSENPSSEVWNPNFARICSNVHHWWIFAKKQLLPRHSSFIFEPGWCDRGGTRNNSLVDFGPEFQRAMQLRIHNSTAGLSDGQRIGCGWVRARFESLKSGSQFVTFCLLGSKNCLDVLNCFRLLSYVTWIDLQEFGSGWVSCLLQAKSCWTSGRWICPCHVSNDRYDRGFLWCLKMGNFSGQIQIQSLKFWDLRNIQEYGKNKHETTAPFYPYQMPLKDKKKRCWSPSVAVQPWLKFLEPKTHGATRSSVLARSDFETGGAGCDGEKAARWSLESKQTFGNKRCKWDAKTIEKLGFRAI